MKAIGRRPILNAAMRQEIVKRLSEGQSVRAAARGVGCDEGTIGGPIASPAQANNVRQLAHAGADGVRHEELHAAGARGGEQDPVAVR